MPRFSETTKYTLYGALFGLCFPVGAVAFLYLIGDIGGPGRSGSLIAQAHHNPLLYIIDSAPFFLGLFARFAGIRQDRLQRLTDSLEEQVQAKTASLEHALEETRQANQTIAHMAEHDALTGLLNRRRFQLELEKWSQFSLRYKRSVALVFIDLDEFKFINDSYGHGAGDRYLSGIADLLASVLRNTDILSRWGGDEFAVLLPETPREAAMEVADKLLRSLNQASIDIGDRKVQPRASIGMALFPEHGSDLNEIMVYADAAMYEAKAAGRNCWRLYSASTHEMERVQEQLQWEGRIRRALENDQFMLFYQPLLRLADSSTPGYEALLRLEDRDGEIISPGEFLGSAERFGLSVSIDHMVVRKVIRKIVSLSEHDIWISLNLSRRSLEDPKLVDHIDTVARENSLKPGLLYIEITEAAAMEYLDQVRGLVERLKAINCRVVLDDFGRGPAYHYLQQLPVDLVKIDGELIHGLLSQDGDHTLISDITAAAHAQGMEVVAKSVENADLLPILHRLGVDYAQGFALGKPVEAIEKIELFLSENTAGDHPA